MFFPDYSTDDLVAIFELLADKNGYELADDARSRLAEVLDAVPREQGFGNGRLARNLLEETMAGHAGRVVALTDPTRDQLATIVAADIPDEPPATAGVSLLSRGRAFDRDDGGSAMSDRVWIRRAYDEPTNNDGYRVLVDRVWPRGVSKEDAQLDEWCKQIAPSTELRKWFGHDPERWDEFRSRYRGELEDRDDLVDALVERTTDGRVTLVFGAKDTDHNQAVVLAELIDERRRSAG